MSDINSLETNISNIVLLHRSVFALIVLYSD